MYARRPTARTGTTSQLRATATPSQARQAIVQETIQAVRTITEQATPSILVHVEGSIITTATGIRPTYPNATCGDYEKFRSSNH